MGISVGVLGIFLKGCVIISVSVLIKACFQSARSFEAFKYLHVGCISELKRKTLPEIALIVGLDNQQGLHHFLTTSPGDVEKLRVRRLEDV